MFKKIILSFLAALVFLQSNINLVAAQDQVTATWYDTGIQTWYQKVYNQNVSSASDIFGERYTAAQVQWIIYSLIVVPMHIVFDSNFTACLFGQAGNEIVTLATCLTGAAGNWLDEKFNALLRFLIPVPIPGVGDNSNYPINNESKAITYFNLIFSQRSSSGVSYLRNTFNRITLVPEAQAQTGFGYTQLDALRGFWTKSRDISYGLLIFAAIILAFMIMFRTKISPQTVISAQSAIPKLIASIILITFSYAIAGFMIDLVYVVIGLIASVFTDNAADLGRAYNLMTAGPGNMGIFGALVAYSIVFPIMFGVSLIGTTEAPGVLSALGGEIGQALVILVAVIMFLIVAILLIVAWLRALFMLIRTLVNIYLLVVFAPFYMVIGTVTSAMGFGSWLKQLISNLAVFPAVGLMLMLANEFMARGTEIVMGVFPGNTQQLITQIFERLGVGQLQAVSTVTAGWAPPLLGLGGSTAAVMMLFVSLAVILLIPNIANIINGFMTGRPFAFGTGIGEAFGPVTGAGRMAGTTAAASAFNVAQGRAEFLGRQTPGWVQAGRRILGVRN